MVISISDLVRLVREHMPPDGPFDEDGFIAALSQDEAGAVLGIVEILPKVTDKTPKKRPIQ
jgi:hypothetical protein